MTHFEWRLNDDDTWKPVLENHMDNKNITPTLRGLCADGRPVQIRKAP